jgi:hypothetical protein
MFSLRLLTTEIRVRSQGSSYTIYKDRVALGQVFFKYIKFSFDVVDMVL